MKQYPGYTLKKSEECVCFHATATVLTHDVSGATVLLLENEDDNKAFGIGFGTFPGDDTGVFHILEHSVLAGSEKYPVLSPFVQLIKSSMASFLNAVTFSDKTVYPFATPNEADYKNLMDVYLNAVFCPLAMTDRRVFEQEGWHRNEDGSYSGVVYNEMQGALATPDAQLGYAMEKALFPDNGYGFNSGGDPAVIPALSYEQYCNVYHRHYRADNCCIVLYGRMDMADKLAFLDSAYLGHMPKRGIRPSTPLQYPQTGVKRTVPYYTETPESVPVQCSLGWYAGKYEDRERNTGISILLDAILDGNQAPLKKYLLEQELGDDIEMSFDDSTQQTVVELTLKGSSAEKAARFAGCVKEGISRIAAEGLDKDMLLASLNSMEFNVMERPGNLPDGVLAAIVGVSGWLHTDDPMADMHPEQLFAAMREKLDTDWFDELMKELFAPEPVEVTLVPCKPIDRNAAAQARTDSKLVLEHPLTVADLGKPNSFPAGTKSDVAGIELLRCPTGGNCYLNMYYDVGNLSPEEMPWLDVMASMLPELGSATHTAQELKTLRNIWLGESRVGLVSWTGRQTGAPVHAKLAARFSLVERNLDKAFELIEELLYDTCLTGEQAEQAIMRNLMQTKLTMEESFVRAGNSYATMRAGAHYSVEKALDERTSGISYYNFICKLLEEGDWAGVAAKLDAVRGKVLANNALTVCIHAGEQTADRLAELLADSRFAAGERQAAQTYVEALTAPVNEAFIIEGGVNYDVLVWPAETPCERKVLAQVMTYDQLWHTVREEGGAYGVGMSSGNGIELLYTYRDPHVRGSYKNFADAPAAVAERDYTAKDVSDHIVATVSRSDPPRKPREKAAETDRRYFCGITDELAEADRAALCGADSEWLRAQAVALPEQMAQGVRCTFGSREAIERADGLFDSVTVLVKG